MREPPSQLPYGRHRIEEDDIAAVAEVLRGNWLTGGPAVARFEEALAEATGAPHAIACSNGTAALHLAALALDLKPDDWVVVPTLTFLATANAARYVGAEVWFADVDPETGLLTAEGLRDAMSLAKRAGKNLRAAFPVHLNGQVADPRGIWEAASGTSLPVVEDACHAIGTTYGTPQGEARAGDGRYATMAAFSFHPVKTVAMGEGGAVTTADPALAAKLRLLRNHGMTRTASEFTEREQAVAPDGAVNPWYYEMHEPGFNYRASDMQCALGASQLGKLARFIAERRALAKLYDELLKPLAPAIRPLSRVADCNPAWHLYVALIDFKALGISRAQVMRGLSEQGIHTQVHYLPVHRQPYYRERYGTFVLPGADAYYERCLSLPLFSGITPDDVARIVYSLKAIVGR